MRSSAAAKPGMVRLESGLVRHRGGGPSAYLNEASHKKSTELREGANGGYCLQSAVAGDCIKPPKELDRKSNYFNNGPKFFKSTTRPEIAASFAGVERSGTPGSLEHKQRAREVGGSIHHE